MIPNDEKTNQTHLLNELKKNQSQFRKKYIILLDADRTICENDTSRILNNYCQIDSNVIKQGFVKHGYTYAGFKNMADIYSELSIDEYLEKSKLVASEIELYPGVVAFIQGMQHLAEICIITSGVKAIWEAILEKNQLVNITLFAGGYTNLDDYVIGRNEKGFLCQYFKSAQKKVIAFGDSDVDTLMLQNADHAIVVVNHRNNWDLISHLKYHTSLYQISFKDYFHEKIKKVTYKSLLTEFNEIEI